MQHETPLTNNAASYVRNRYRSMDQAWVNRREQRLITRLLTSYNLARRSILDVPCGYGRFFSLYEGLGMTVTGVDLSVSMLQHARMDHAPDCQRHVLCGSIFHLPFADATFDAVLCIRLLHHQLHETERHRLFVELSRVARHYVLISFYRFNWLHAWSCVWRWRRKGRLPAILTPTALNTLASSCHLRILSTHALLRYGHMQTFAMLSKEHPTTSEQVEHRLTASQPPPALVEAHTSPRERCARLG